MEFLGGVEEHRTLVSTENYKKTCMNNYTVDYQQLTTTASFKV